MTARKCNTLDPSRRDVAETGSVAVSTANGKSNTSACEWIPPQYHRTRMATMPSKIGVENLVQSAWSPSRLSKLANTIHPVVKPRSRFTQ
jgi:hypothetical protein